MSNEQEVLNFTTSNIGTWSLIRSELSVGKVLFAFYDKEFGLLCDSIHHHVVNLIYSPKADT